MTKTLQLRYDVVVVGGGAAGLNGALILARSRRTVLVVDAGAPRNAVAAGVHGFLTRDGIPPSELTALGREEVCAYGGEVTTGEVIAATRDADGFAVLLTDGRSVPARRLLVTTGLVDALPDLPGVTELWGRDVVHCPFCHGWEVRDTAIGVLATGPRAVHQAQLFAQLSDDVVVFENGVEFPDEGREQLEALGITTIRGHVAELTIVGDRLSGVGLVDGTVVARQTVVVAPRMVARGGLLESLGLSPAPHPMGADLGEYLPSEAQGRTAVAGVWVAGNVTDLMAQVGAAAAGGAAAGAAVHGDLIGQHTAQAVADRRARHHDHPTIGFDADFWNDRYGSKEQIWSGNPNLRLVEQVADLRPGSALDVGCGEGADAIWLAERGWQVEAADISTVALERAATHAQATAPEAAGRIRWTEADFLTWAATGTQYDLVSAQFMHLRPTDRDRLVAELAAAVRPGGTLLVVAHSPGDLATTMGRPPHTELFYTGDDVLSCLDAAAWEVKVNADMPRSAMDPDGNEIDISDTVFRAVRRGVALAHPGSG